MKATIQRIDALKPIENDDKFETAIVLNFPVIVSKGMFQVGDTCILFKANSILPVAEWTKPWIHPANPDKPIKLYYDLALPIKDVFKMLPPPKQWIVEEFGLMNLGDDVTELLNVK